MNGMLSPGLTLKSVTASLPCTVGKLLGAGGQGEVYKASWNGTDVALKWYFTHTSTHDQRIALEELTKRSPPSPAFLWPLDIVTREGTEAFGYVMPLRDARFRGLQELVKGRVDPTFRAITTFAMGIVSNMLKLHAEGLCYCDINFGNAFFDPSNGQVLICDNDNVTTNGNERVTILGSPDFIAPELVRREALPSLTTDLHSLAVLLFYVFHNTHPLLGRKLLAIRAWDPAARVKLLGREPLFIFDPNDTSNGPVPAKEDPTKYAGHPAIAYWPIFPEYFRRMFVEAFTQGLTDPAHGRVRESQWLGMLSRLRDNICRCQNCGKENFHDGVTNQPCWNPQCKRDLTLPTRITIGKNTILLSPDAQLYRHHLAQTSEIDPYSVVAEVVSHPTNKALCGLRNRDSTKWIVQIPGADGKLTQIDVEPGKSVTITPGTRVTFGTAAGEMS